MNKNHLQRALRCGKLTLAALEATLRRYRHSPDIVQEIPTLRSFTRAIDEIGELGKQLLPNLQTALGDGYRLALEESTSQIGSGALPTEELPTMVIAVTHATFNANRIAERFRRADPPIIGRIQEGRFLLDLRTIFDSNDVIPKFNDDRH
jgi:L-seryl-tRNA(Ser) seleniumtransferase